MRRYLACLALLLACLFVTTACDLPFIGSIGGLGDSSTAHQQVTPLSGTSWALTQLTIAGRSQSLAPTAPVTLQFQPNGDTYLGSSGCNYYSGDYTISGHQIHLEFGAVTQRACAGPIMSQEVAYLNAMEQVRGFQADKDALTLNDSGGRPILVYRAA
ncbi:MAG TPA: META domain-containing protein [Ktedonobacterales bacterium]|nr:META domain-containing protein [Ktedonobacterales bacterium]